ncbi:MAG: phosphoglucosamine mutase, partial [Clostridia bacterium]|nr:phosphoglucosamine mutase [Clostridia bacterium]
VRGFNKKPQMTLSVRARDKNAVVRSASFCEAVKRVENGLCGRGRLLVRPSGTEEAVRITVEGRTQEECERACGELEDAVKKCEGGK